MVSLAHNPRRRSPWGSRSPEVGWDRALALTHVTCWYILHGLRLSKQQDKFTSGGCTCWYILHTTCACVHAMSMLWYAPKTCMEQLHVHYNNAWRCMLAHNPRGRSLWGSSQEVDWDRAWQNRWASLPGNTKLILLSKILWAEFCKPMCKSYNPIGKS